MSGRFTIVFRGRIPREGPIQNTEKREELSET